MPSIAVRISDSERVILDNLAGGDISKYVRNVIFGNGRRQAESINWLENQVDGLRHRVDNLLQNQADLLDTVRELADEVRELKAALPPQSQPIAAPAQDNSRIEGMTLELLLLLRGNVSLTDRKRIHATVEREGLPVWEDSAPPSSFMASNTTERRPQVEVQEPPARDERSQGGFLKRWRS